MDENGRQLEIEDKVKLTLLINPIQDGLFRGCSEAHPP